MARKSIRAIVGLAVLLTACRPLATKGDIAASGAVEKAERRIDSILDGPLRTPLDYQEAPLDHVLAALQEEYDVPFQFNRQAFEALTIAPDVKVSLTIRGVTLRSSLELLLASVEGIDYVVDHEAVIITSTNEAASRMVMRVYRVSDLPVMRSVKSPRGASAWADYDPLMGVITECIEPNSWTESGRGEGEISRLLPGMYVIRQTKRIHRQIEQLLAEIRRCKADIERDAARAKVVLPPRDDDPFGGF
jgi:hypothetical protein